MSSIIKYTPKVVIPFGWMTKILKVPVYRLALGSDLVSRIIISVSMFFSRIFGGRSFSPVRAQKSIDRFQALGAEVNFITPSDGKGKIQMMTFKAADLEQKIQAVGASWTRRVIGGRGVFAIIPPLRMSTAWVQLKEKLSHFHWKEEEGMLITSDCASDIPDDEKKCFLHAHSTSMSFASDWKRAGFYIGAKQDLCFFDNGNTWKNSGRPPSEKSFYAEIGAVYDKIKDQYPPEHLWVGGFCNGGPVAAHLKACLHDKGVNFYIEHSFSDLDDFVKPITSFFAPRIKGALSKDPESYFDVVGLWKDLKKKEQGRVILVQVKDDEHLAPSAYQRYLALAKRVNANVTHIFYASTVKYHHADDFFRYEASRRQFVQTVFSPLKMSNS